MNAHYEIATALEEHVLTWQDLPFDGDSEQVAWPNVDFTPPTENDVHWISIDHLPGTTNRRTGGDDGYSEIEGQMSLSVFGPVGVGTAGLTKLADSLVKHFKSGTQLLSPGGLRVTIRRAFLSAAGSGIITRSGAQVQTDTFHRINVYIQWYTHHNEV
jgi:hypothetical protein